MKSNYHTVRKAIATRGVDKPMQKLGGAKRSWAWSDKAARRHTGQVKVIKIT